MRRSVYGIATLVIATFACPGNAHIPQIAPGGGIQVAFAGQRNATRRFFIENVGQIGDPAVRYYIEYPGMNISFEDGQVRFEGFGWETHAEGRGQPQNWQAADRVGFTLEIGNRRLRPRASGRGDGYSNYYIGSDSDNWRTHVRHYEHVIYEDVYPGINLVCSFNEQGELVCEYYVNSGADADVIEMRYTRINGIQVRAGGTVAAHSTAGTLLHGRLLAYQVKAGHQDLVESAFEVRGSHSIGVQLPQSRNQSRKVVIDPTLTFSTYWGSGGTNNRTVAIDPVGNIYMSGGTSQTEWPTTIGSPHRGDSDVTVAKFDPNGKLIWSTLLGGPAEDYAYVSAVNEKGELYVSGRAGYGFPTTPGAFDRTFNGGIGGGPHKPTDAFVVKLSPKGELVYSTYIGGNGDENGRAIHLLPSGKLIVGGGNTTATDLPTDRGTIPGPVLKPKKGGLKDSWVAVVAPDGKSLEFLTYFGPNNDDAKRGDETIRALGVDAVGNIWIGGTTTTGTDMTATPGAFQKIRGRHSEAYIAKISKDGKRLIYFSWIGGDGNDEIETEGVSDAAGNFYVAGSTGSSDFPTTPGAFQSTLKGGLAGKFADGWVARINNDGSLGVATLYGGTTVGPEALFGPIVDQAGNVYATGRFRSDDCPTTDDAFQRNLAGRQDAVLVVFSADGKRLLYGSYFGGSGMDQGRHIGIHPNGSAVYIIGETNSTDLPLVNAPQKTPSGAFLAKFTIAAGPAAN